MRHLAVFLLIAFVAVGCSGGSSSTLVDGVEITDDEFAALHVDVSALDEDERANSLLLMILRESFGTRAATEWDVIPSDAEVDEAFEVYVERYASRGGLETVVGASNHTADRVRIEAELDVLRSEVSETLVRSEAPGFDLDLAYEGYLLIEAEVCLRLIQLEAGPDFDVALARLDAGEDFATVARDLSIDPFVGRDEGSGAGGDLGCSAPNALPGGLDTASLQAPVGEPTGPVLADTGLYLIDVYERTAPELDEVRNEVIDFAVDQQGPEMFRLWAVGVLQTIEVEVGSEYGSWAVLPETDPVPTVVTPTRIDDVIEAS